MSALVQSSILPRYVQPAKKLYFIGFSDNKHTATYKEENEQAKLTIEEMNAYVFLLLPP
jgi:hypothetical protein